MSARDNVFINIEKRMFYIHDDIDEDSISKVCYNLLNILTDDQQKEDKEKNYNREPIKIYINSYGGNVYDMWALIDIMLNSKTPIHTYCTGYAMSAAFQIFLAGHRRFATKHSTFMYHQISCWRQGKYQDLVEDRQQMDFLQKKIEEYVIDRTKLTQSDINDIREKKKDFFVHPEEALKYGIISEII